MALDRKTLSILALAIVAGLGAAWLLKNPAPKNDDDGISIALPDLNVKQTAGKGLFDKNCASCHGRSGSGTKQGPPLIHKYYESSHHGDVAFVSAARNGVRAHHWKFGDMPPVNSVSDTDVEKIIDYIRTVQRKNGIS